MYTMRMLLAMIFVGAATMLSMAGQFNKTISIGDAAPAFADLQGTDGKTHSLKDVTADVVVLVFTCNSCPIAVQYEDRLVALAKLHAGPNTKVAILAVNVNTVAEDQLPKMIERATKKQFNFVYMYDPSQQIAKAYGANYTPECFVLNKDRKIVYMGAFDDNTTAEKVTIPYVADAIRAALDGKDAPKAETLARGCRIRFNRDTK